MFRITFITAFFTLAVLPVVEWVTGIIDIPPLQERRWLAPPPDFGATVWHGDGRLAAGINKWFDDHYGFRPLFVRLKNQLDYWAFRHSDKVFIGHQGWLYHPQFFDGLIDAERAGEVGAYLVHQRFLGMARYLEDRGIRLIVINNPAKESTYRQFLPDGVPHIPQNNRYQQLRVWLKSRREFDYIDGSEVLGQCHRWRTFNFLDIHMTMPGGVCFAEALIAQIAEDEHRASPWDRNFTYTEMPSTAGGLNDFLSLLFPISQPIYLADHTYEDDVTSDSGEVFEWVYLAPFSVEDDLLPATVLYGDSFLDHYRNAGFQSYLSAVYRARDNGKNLLTVLRSLPPGTHYFVFEFLEPWLNAIATQPIPLERLAE
jgi:hypothetical protein